MTKRAAIIMLIELLFCLSSLKGTAFRKLNQKSNDTDTNGEFCNSSVTCSQYSSCNTVDNLCHCNDVTIQSICYPKASYGESCTYSEQCEMTDAHLYCDAYSTCFCVQDYEWDGDSCDYSSCLALCTSDEQCQLIDPHMYCDNFYLACYCSYYYYCDGGKCFYYMSTGDIFGIFFGVLSVVVILGGCVVYCYKRIRGSEEILPPVTVSENDLPS